MTVPDIVTLANTIGVIGLFAVFVAGVYYRKVMFTHHHQEIVNLHEQRFTDLERQSKAIEEDLRRQLEAAVKRGNEWQDMAWQQKRTVDKSLEVVTVSAEKSTK
jgi:hypothetical protein